MSFWQSVKSFKFQTKVKEKPSLFLCCVMQSLPLETLFKHAKKNTTKELLMGKNLRKSKIFLSKGEQAYFRGSIWFIRTWSEVRLQKNQEAKLKNAHT